MMKENSFNSADGLDSADKVRPVNVERIMETLTKLGFHFEMSGEFEDRILVGFKPFLAEVALYDQLDPFLMVDARPWVALDASRENDLLHQIMRRNRGTAWPQIHYSLDDEGKLELSLKSRYATRIGMTEAQLHTAISGGFAAAHGAFADLLEEFPELLSLPEGITELFGESDVPFVKPVTLDRVEAVLRSKGIKEIYYTSDKFYLVFMAGEGTFFVYISDDGESLTISLEVGLNIREDNFFELGKLANDINRAGGVTHAVVREENFAYDLWLESCVRINNGLSPAQLAVAIDDAFRKHCSVAHQYRETISYLRKCSTERTFPTYLDGKIRVFYGEDAGGGEDDFEECCGNPDTWPTSAVEVQMSLFADDENSEERKDGA